MANEPTTEQTVADGHIASTTSLETPGIGDDNSERLDLGLLRQVPMTVHVELGRTTMTLGEILDELRIGSSIRLDRHSGDPVEVYVNGALFARAEVVVMQDRIGAKIVEMVDASNNTRPAGLR